MKWQPIEIAPKDGRLVWVQGNNWGDESDGTHCGWAYWNGKGWMWAAPDSSHATFLTKWLPAAIHE